MLGKPVAEVTVADLQDLIDSSVPEGRHLEYKEDVPVSAEEQKRQRKDNPQARPLDRSWVAGRGPSPHGQTSLLEELVAFANAGGGVVVLGMAETETAPPRAAELRPLPNVARLERSLRDAIVSSIEPRLPYAAVRALPLTADGAGVVLMEAAASILAPHRVEPSRRCTIRREDRCDPLTMTEIHEMVLRNARRFDEVSAKLAEAQHRFEPFFVETLAAACPPNFLGPSGRERVAVWFQQAGLSALGLRVTLVPHALLGLSRLENLSGLVPGTGVVHLAGSPHHQLQTHLFLPSERGGRRILGGVTQTKTEREWRLDTTMTREGFVELTLVTWEQRSQLFAFVDWLVSALGAVMGIYHRLRDRAGAPTMPAEITAEILAWNDLRPAPLDSHGPGTGAKPLPWQSLFPRFTIAEGADFEACLNESAADLMNAGDVSARVLPRFVFDPT